MYVGDRDNPRFARKHYTHEVSYLGVDQEVAPVGARGAMEAPADVVHRSGVLLVLAADHRRHLSAQRASRSVSKGELAGRMRHV